MDENAYPLDSVLRCAEQGLVPKLFTVQNAKDELKRLRKSISNIEHILANPVAWARINDFGDLYDLRTQNNPYINPKIVIPLYRLDYEQ